MLSPNDVRREEGWPASSDPTADSIEPPVAGGAQPSEGDEPKPPAPAPSDDEGEVNERGAVDTLQVLQTKLFGG